MRSLRTAGKSSPRSPQLEKARAQQQRPNAAKNKLKKINLWKEKSVMFEKKKREIKCYPSFKIPDSPCPYLVCDPYYIIP